LKNFSLLMFFPFFTTDTNNSHLFSFFAVTTTLIFTWYYKETITNFWKSWWNKNKENVNTNNNSNSTTKTTSEEPKVEQTNASSSENISKVTSEEPKVEQSEVATATTVVKDEAVAPTITQSEVATAPIVEQSKTIVLSGGTTITQSESQAVVVLTVEQSEEVITAITVVKDEAVAPTITQSEVVTATTVVKDEVSAAPSDNIPETISKKWYDYPMDKIQVVFITDENRMIPQGTLEFNHEEKLTSVAILVNSVNSNICTSIRRSHQDDVDIGFKNLHDFKNSEEILDIKQKFLTSTKNLYSLCRIVVNNFIDLNQNKKVGLFVELKKPLLIGQKEHTLFELDAIKSYEEILDKTIDSSEIFINVTRMGLYDQLLSKSIEVLCMKNYFFLTDATIKVEKKTYINLLCNGYDLSGKSLTLSDKACKRKASIFKETFKLEDYILDQEEHINANVAKTYEECQQYYFLNYYKNINLFFSENQQIDLFNRLITKEYFANISNENEIPCLNFLLSEFEKLNYKRENILYITKREVMPIYSNKIPSKTITDTILTDIYDLQPKTTATSKEAYDQIEELLPAKDTSKIYDIITNFLTTKHLFYVDHIDKINDFLNIIISIKN